MAAERKGKGRGPVKGKTILTQVWLNNLQKLGQPDNFYYFSLFQYDCHFWRWAVLAALQAPITVRHLWTMENRQQNWYKQKKMSRKLKCQSCVGCLFWLMVMIRWFLWNAFFCYITTRFVPYVSNWNFNTPYPPSAEANWVISLILFLLYFMLRMLHVSTIDTACAKAVKGIFKNCAYYWIVCSTDKENTGDMRVLH